MELGVRRARFVYDTCRNHAIALNCPVIPPIWNERRLEFRDQFITLIVDLISGRRQFDDPRTAHDSWMKKYQELGWTYGEQYDFENKIHPDLAPFDELDPKEQIKDEVFRAIVTFAKKYIW